MLHLQTSRVRLTWSVIPVTLLILGRLGLFSVVLRPLGLGMAVQYGALTLTCLFLIGTTLFLERGSWPEFFLTRRNLWPSIRDGIIVACGCVGTGWGYALITLGGVFWLPLQDWLPTFLAALIPAAVVEEVMTRGFLLGFLRRWGVSDGWGLAMTTLLFGPVFHARYLYTDNYLALGIVTLFGLTAGVLTLRRGNLAAAIVGHTAMDFSLFLFIGGRVTSL